MKTLINPPLARDSDPITSHEAAEKMVKSGKLIGQEHQVYDAIIYSFAVLDADNFTAKELSKWTDSDYYMIQRRLSGLHYKGKIERTGEKRNGCAVWRLK